MELAASALAPSLWSLSNAAKSDRMKMDAELAT